MNTYRARHLGPSVIAVEAPSLRPGDEVLVEVNEHMTSRQIVAAPSEDLGDGTFKVKMRNDDGKVNEVRVYFN